LDDEVDGCADCYAGEEVCFSVWHRVPFICYGISASRFFHG
jgi:hypothetical protein